MQDEIVARLRAIEDENDVRIIYACEAGSRAYGLDHALSDYDVRFFYVRKPEAYLSVCETNKEIRPQISGSWDANGWDLRKALRLLRESNPSVLEWLHSPVVYKGTRGDSADGGRTAQALREIATDHTCRRACMHHYHSWFRSKYKPDSCAPGGPLKSVMHSVRLIMAMRWLELGNQIVPVPFVELTEGTLDCNVPKETAILDACKEIVADRRGGLQVSEKKYMTTIGDFLESEVKRFSKRKFGDTAVTKVSFERLDEVFRDSIRAAWT